MSNSNTNGSKPNTTEPIMLDNLKIDTEPKKTHLLEDIKIAYEQLFREIKYNTDLTIREILNESNLKIMKMQHEYEQKIKEVKLKQWCINCGKEAVYYCCKNTSYCNETCQHQHWSKHFKTCLRINSRNDGEFDDPMD
ncbi:unnamed protein product [Brachionus calyciflorus]|uniref:MYND-type domain-containing protein n=1 Tax=Brachionus calyciflorus TaxID=104777 RepID=A0A814E0K7_9BILA|nr:unnamed protein product [Brachionus calyciflorus]